MDDLYRARVQALGQVEQKWKFESVNHRKGECDDPTG